MKSLRTLQKTVLLYTAQLVFVLMFSCKSSEANAERAKKLSNLEIALNSKDFKIDINTVYPFNTIATTQVLNQITRNTGNTANQIMINGYDITFKNDSIIGELPYYGERQLSSSRYNNHLGIALKGIPQNYSLTKHKKKDAYVVKFNMDDNSDTVETYNVVMTFYTNKMVDINIVSSHRRSISYRGRLVDVE